MLTSGTLLGGRVHYDQPAEGYRTGLEPVLLAASIPARAGDSVLEAGCGAGAGLLCLAARVAGITGVGLERDTNLAALAAANLASNSFAAISAEQADVTQWRSGRLFDHAFANPPWHAESGTAPQPGRRAAKQAYAGLLAQWVAAMARALRPRGTLSLILPGGALTEAVVALSAAKCPEITVIPLWPRLKTPAKILIIQAIRLGKGPGRLLPGLVLHGEEGFTPETARVLTDAAGLV
jgi:tRNA1(Val) A37 N6-methylase TrmN6